MPIKQKREGKLSPYRDIVLKWLTEDKKAPHKQQHTAKRVHDRLEELYPNEFDAHKRSVRKFVAKLRKELVMVTDGFLPLEHPPGEAQVSKQKLSTALPIYVMGSHQTPSICKYTKDRHVKIY